MKYPEHIAIIMDGNGRWAKKKNLPRILGHRAGVKTANSIIEACTRKGIKALTLYTFSVENWNRPKKEVDALMNLLGRMLKENSKKMKENNIRFNVIGQIDGLPDSLSAVIKDTMSETSSNEGMILTLALNYSGRVEILDAVKRILADGKNNVESVSSWTEKEFEKFLYTNNLPEVDLIIRTSGEMRISNFLLWQSAYAEFYVTDILWPDFKVDDLDKALEEYQNRDRRFGE